MNPSRHTGRMVIPFVARAACAAACAIGVVAMDAHASTAPCADAVSLTTPARLASPSLDLVPAMMVGENRPELALAQRTIDRGLGTPAPSPELMYPEGEVGGFKSPALATGLSALVPGTGQLYSGSNRGYLFLGIEAVVLASVVTLNSKADNKRDEYFSFVGDPNSAGSRFSFERFAATAPPAEVERLRGMYERDQREFYDAVTMDNSFAAGWDNPNARFDAGTLSAESDSYAKKSNTAFYVLIANHLVSAVDALNLARFNNFALRENLTVKLKLNPGFRRSSYGLTLTQKF